MEQIRSADVLANFPQVDEEKLNAVLAAEAAASNRKIIVLDDDPTGVQTVHDIYVYALQSCVGRLTASPAFVVAKGGITSSDVGVKALRVKCAKVLGQIRPGIPVWQTGAESLFPGTPYIIFPGNVGEVPTLREAVEILLG